MFCSILGCLLFLICTEFVYLYFPVLFCLSVSVKWLAVKTASEMTYTVSSGALNSTPTNQRSAPSNRTDCLTDWYADGRRAQSVMSRSCCICRHGHTVRAGGVDDTHTHTHTQTDGPHRHIQHTGSTQPCIPTSRVALSSSSFGWGEGGMLPLSGGR